jgi:hypothetical protein
LEGGGTQEEKAEDFGRVIDASEEARVKLAETLWKDGVEARERGEAEEAAKLFEAGAQFACFTSTEVHILTQRSSHRRAGGSRGRGGGRRCWDWEGDGFRGVCGKIL